MIKGLSANNADFELIMKDADGNVLDVYSKPFNTNDHPTLEDKVHQKINDEWYYTPAGTPNTENSAFSSDYVKLGEEATSSVGDVTADGIVAVACYDIMGNKLGGEPEQGLYIEIYTDGTSKKIFKK
jgi:hypothetical protein